MINASSLPRMKKTFLNTLEGMIKEHNECARLCCYRLYEAEQNGINSWRDVSCTMINTERAQRAIAIRQWGEAFDLCITKTEHELKEGSGFHYATFELVIEKED